MERGRPTSSLEDELFGLGALQRSLASTLEKLSGELVKHISGSLQDIAEATREAPSIIEAVAEFRRDKVKYSTPSVISEPLSSVISENEKSENAATTYPLYIITPKKPLSSELTIPEQRAILVQLNLTDQDAVVLKAAQGTELSGTFEFLFEERVDIYLLSDRLCIVSQKTKPKKASSVKSSPVKKLHFLGGLFSFDSPSSPNSKAHQLNASDTGRPEGNAACNLKCFWLKDVELFDVDDPEHFITRTIKIKSVQGISSGSLIKFDREGDKEAWLNALKEAIDQQRPPETLSNNKADLAIGTFVLHDDPSDVSKECILELLDEFFEAIESCAYPLAMECYDKIKYRLEQNTTALSQEAHEKIAKRIAQDLDILISYLLKDLESSVGTEDVNVVFLVDALVQLDQEENARKAFLCEYTKLLKDARFSDCLLDNTPALIDSVSKQSMNGMLDALQAYKMLFKGNHLATFVAWLHDEFSCLGKLTNNLLRTLNNEQYKEAMQRLNQNVNLLSLSENIDGMSVIKAYLQD